MWHMTFDFDIFRVLVGSCGKKKNMDLVGIAGGNNVCWRGPSERRGEERFTSGINYVRGLTIFRKRV